MSLSPEDVQRIAHLARLQLSESELGAYSVQLQAIVAFVGQLQAVDTQGVEPMVHLQAIVAFVDQLQAVDTTGVEPMVHAIELSNVLAADEVRVGLSRDAALSNSPDHDEECFRVPAVLG